MYKSIDRFDVYLKGLPFLLVIGFYLFSCEGPGVSSDPLTFPQITGTYRANFGQAQLDEIVLNPDSTYLHSYVSQEGRQFVDSGRFSIVDQGRHRYYLDIPEFVVFAPVGDRCTNEISRNASQIDTVDWLVRIWRSGGLQVIDYCPHGRQEYVKIQ